MHPKFDESNFPSLLTQMAGEPLEDYIQRIRESTGDEHIKDEARLSAVAMRSASEQASEQLRRKRLLGWLPRMTR